MQIGALAAQVLEIEPEAAIGRSAIEWIAPGDRAEFKQALIASAAELWQGTLQTIFRQKEWMSMQAVIRAAPELGTGLLLLCATESVPLGRDRLGTNGDKPLRSQSVLEPRQPVDAAQSQENPQCSLNRTARALHHSLHLKTIFATATKLLASDFNLPHSSIWHYNHSHHHWQVVSLYSGGRALEAPLALEISAPGLDWRLVEKRQLLATLTVEEALAGEVPAELVRNLPDPWLAIPLQAQGQLWGCAIVAAYSDTDLASAAPLMAFVEQLETAIEQAEQYKQAQRLNFDLERQIRSRTFQLQQALELEELLKSIADKVRDSLDEDRVLQTVVEELSFGLGVDCCETALYSESHTDYTIRYEHTTTFPSLRGYRARINPNDRIQHQLIGGNHLQFCPLDGEFVRADAQQCAVLACPILDDRGVLGNLWLYRPRACSFGDLEVRIVQQIANQCAIAIRQARLYQASQRQVQELERINQLKDDFLDTVSHELRTPITTMRMAIQMLELRLKRQLNLEEELQKPLAQQDSTVRYFHILKQECDREIKLIDDLLKLQRLDGRGYTPQLQTIRLEAWLPERAATFRERARDRQQDFQLDLPSALPAFSTDPSSLERIVTELLHNANKYTPPGGQIALSAKTEPDRIQLVVTNTGVEIPDSALPHVFDKFYRVPSIDRWKQGGTGLGLALVKQLVEQLNGSICACSGDDRTTFVVELPQLMPSHLAETPLAR
ncbi:GAF domain-containing sensor histidine kinase [Synechococcus sp. PCC 7336]|uniref:sensor histidine kinase n=1 Tax=Synechococcus sp. PCC 7336 TaxID=195250 RepID=UPI000379615E|nr:GAF domain-containing sensor histidine kinase [Synechococcus sp. PCC 7336]